MKMMRMAMMKSVLVQRFFCMARCSLLPLLGSGDGNHGGLADFEAKVVGRDAEMERIVFERDDGAADAAAGDDAVAGLECLEHGLPFLLAALLRQDQDEVGNRDHEQHRQKQSAGGGAGRLGKNQDCGAAAGALL